MRTRSHTKLAREMFQTLLAIKSTTCTYTERFTVGCALQVMAQLVVGKMRSGRANHVPPSGGTDSANTDVGTDSHVTEEQPSGDQTLRSTTGRLVHDVQVRGVEAQSGGRETVSDQVDPEKLDRDQSFGQAESSSQENTHNLKATYSVLCC